MAHPQARWRRWLGTLLLSAPICLAAAPIPVHNPEGTLHGFLVLRDQQGHDLALGDLINQVHGNRVTVQMVFHFKDGSVDDEISVFSQRGHFRLISDHHLQKGPFFAHPMDLTVNVPKGQVTVRSWDKDGKESVHNEQMNLPPDLCSATMLTPVAKNLSAGATAEVSMLVATPKPMLIKLAYSTQGEEEYQIAGLARKAEHYQIKFELQGLASVVAPLVHKQPPNLDMWIEPGTVPAFVEEKGVLAQDGPVVTVESIGPSSVAGSSE